MVAASRKDRVRLVTLVYRKKDTSFEDFSNYWANEHAKLFKELPIAKQNLLSYEQSHANPESVQQLTHVGFPCSDADGMAIFEAESSEKLWAVFQDEEYHKVAVPDEEKFMDRERSLAFPAEIVSVFSQ
ncbi:hypothetical protein ACLMJK_003852 [Lecanora helva]